MLSHTRRKNSLDSQSAFFTHSVAYILYQVHILYPVCSLHFVLTGIRGTNTVYFWLQLFAQHAQSTTKHLCVSWFDIFVLFHVNTPLSFCKNVDITYNVSSNPHPPKKLLHAEHSYAHLRNDKGDLKGFPTNFETLFLQLPVTDWHQSIRERIRKKNASTLLKKNNGTSLARTVTTMFSSKRVNDLTQGDLMWLFLIEFFQFLFCNLRYKCLNWTDLERLPESVFQVCTA